MTNKPFIALITDNNALMVACQRALKSLPEIEWKHFVDANAYLEDKPRPTSALIIDVKLSIQTKGVAKETLIAMEPHIPVLRVRLLDDNNVFSAWREHSGTNDEFIRQFVLNQCMHSHPFQLRKYYRHTVHLPMLLSRSPNFEPSSAIKAVTLNASPGGMYLISTDDFKMDEEIWLKVHGKDEIKPVKLKVRWVQPWSETKKSLPGIGAQLVESNQDFMLFMANVNKVTK